MKRTLLFKALFTTALLLLMILVYVFLYLPQNWGRIKPGMSRSQVVELVGVPDFDSGDIKGCFWYFGKTPVVFELNVFFDPSGKAVHVNVWQFLGPESGAYVRHLKWETLSRT